MLQAVDGLNLATNVEFASFLEEVFNSRVSLINATKDLGGLKLPVVGLIISTRLYVCLYGGKGFAAAIFTHLLGL